MSRTPTLREVASPATLSARRRAGLALVLGLVLIGAAGWLWMGYPAAFYAPATPQPTPTSWPALERFKSPDYGVNIHFWWDPWSSIRRDWKLVQDAGFTWVKQRLAWQDVEGDGPGRYIWAGADRIVTEAEQAGVNLLFRVDSPPAWAIPPTETGQAVDAEAFGAFCHTLATRYQGRVRGYQVWNEPNLAREWRGLPPDPAGYVALLRACYIGVKTADPQAYIISAGLAPTGSSLPEALPDTDYLEKLYQAGAAPYFDLLGLNAPGYKAPPDIAPEVAADPAQGYGGQRFFCFRHVEDMRAIMERYGDGDKQIALLEFGWHTNVNPEHPDYAWFGVTPDQQAEYLVGAFRYAHAHWSPWIGPMFVWNIPDSHWEPQNEEFWWSIVDPFWYNHINPHDQWPGAPVRPAYEALAAMEKP